MKNKVYFVKKLCELRNMDIESAEAHAFYDLKIVDILIAIKQAKPPDAVDAVVTEDDQSLAQLLGCT